jgi:hypothetical protein
MTRHQRLGAPIPFSYPQSTTDAFGWRKPKEVAAPSGLPSLADWRKIAAKVAVLTSTTEQIVQAVSAQQEQSETSKAIRKLSEALRKPPLAGTGRPSSPQRALHLRDEGFDPFFQLVEERKKRGLQ